MYLYARQRCRWDIVLFSTSRLTYEITAKPPGGVGASLATNSLALSCVTFGNIPFRGLADSKSWPIGQGHRLQPRRTNFFSRRLNRSVEIQCSFLDRVVGRFQLAFAGSRGRFASAPTTRRRAGLCG